MSDWGSIIGALTGVAALVISVMSYRYAKKVDDQAISLKRDELVNDITIQFETLPLLIKEADRSKTFNLAAKGQFHSGVTVAWAQSINDLNKVLATHRKEYEDALKLNTDKVLQLKQLDRLKKVLNEHADWLNRSIREDREEALKN